MEKQLVIYVYLTEDDYKKGKYTHISAANETMQNNPVYFISDEETARMKGLALERWEYFADAVTNPENNGLINSYNNSTVSGFSSNSVGINVVIHMFL